MSDYVFCDGVISTNPDGSLSCSTGFVVVEPNVFHGATELTIDEANEIIPTALLVWATAWGFKRFVNFIWTNLPGRFG